MFHWKISEIRTERSHSEFVPLMNDHTGIHKSCFAAAHLGKRTTGNAA